MNQQQSLTPLSLPETPLEAVQDLIDEKVIVEGHSFLIMRPTDSDKLLDHPAVRAAFAADEYMPYWTDLWPAARMLAKAIMRENWQKGLQALEIGCGLGLPGIAALAKGLRVTFTDYDATALKFAANNAQANGFNEFETLQLDWRYPPPDLKFPLVLGADLIYETRSVEPVVNLIKQVLTPNGVALLADQDRIPTEQFRQALTDRGFLFTTKIMHAGEPGGRRVKGSLYRITQPS
jgi:predicted nicotinamide N-methyase